jgi:hypothetical protein
MKNKTYKRQYKQNKTILFYFILAGFLLVFINWLSVKDIATYYDLNAILPLANGNIATISTTTKQDITITKLPSIYNNEVEFKIRTIAAAQGFQWPDYLVRLAFNESSLNPSAISKPNRNGSRDYGLFQFNDKQPPLPITKECALDLECSTLKAIEAINNGDQDHWTQDEISKAK